MQYLKPAVRPLTAQSDLINHKRRGQIRQMVLHPLPPHRDHFVRHSPREGQVEFERLHQIGIPPLRQHFLLQRGQASFATAGQFGVTGRCAEPVKIADTAIGDLAQRPEIPARRQRQKPAQNRHIQALARGRRDRSRQRRCGAFQILDRCAIFQPERRLQGSMKPIFARCHRYATQTWHIWLRDVATSGNIPSKPASTRLCQRTIRRNIVKCKSRV